MRAPRLALVLVFTTAASGVIGTRAVAAQTTDIYTISLADPPETQTWVVPDGVTSASFDVRGASGGPNTGGSIGGSGGRAVATLDVTPGETIYINVGAAGPQTYIDGTDITLTARPKRGHRFAGWSGDCTGRGRCVLDMTDDRTAHARFRRRR
jgi:hypothetical protein